MSEQATEPGVVEGGHLQKSLKTQRMTMVSLGDVIEAVETARSLPSLCAATR